MPLQRAIVAVVSTLILIPWIWRRVWNATAVLDWDQADLDHDVVPEDVWNSIVAVIEGHEAQEWAEPEDED